MTTAEDARRRLEDDRAAVRRARDESRRIAQVLQRSQRVSQEVLPKLRRAGQVR
jgi:hypothetical protein